MFSLNSVKINLSMNLILIIFSYELEQLELHLILILELHLTGINFQNIFCSIIITVLRYPYILDPKKNQVILINFLLIP